jgi:hypothetical protein
MLASLCISLSVSCETFPHTFNGHLPGDTNNLLQKSSDFVVKSHIPIFPLLQSPGILQNPRLRRIATSAFILYTSLS